MTPHEVIDFRREGRWLSGLLVADLGFGMAQLGLLILTEERSIVARIAGLAGNSVVLASAFLLLALLLLPYLLMQTVNPTSIARMKVVRLTVYALMAAGVLRIYFAYLSRNLDIDTVTGIFVLNGFWYIAMAALLAYSINNKQKRDAA